MHQDKCLSLRCVYSHFLMYITTCGTSIYTSTQSNIPLKLVHTKLCAELVKYITNLGTDQRLDVCVCVNWPSFIIFMKLLPEIIFPTTK